MFRLDAGSGLTLMLRRLRSRFGISAPRVAIRTHLPWYWRVTAVVLLTGASLALAGWIYDAGRRFAGLDSGASSSEMLALQEKLTHLTAELEAAQRIASSSESRLRIESTALERLTAQIRTLEEENVRLKSDLAMFENLAGGAADSKLAISRLHVEKAAAEGVYRYRLLIAQTGEPKEKEKEFKGAIQFSATVQRGGETVVLPFPAPGEAAAPYQVSFRYFRRMEGNFSLPKGSRLEKVEVRLLQNGIVKASQTMVL